MRAGSQAALLALAFSPCGGLDAGGARAEAAPVRDVAGNERGGDDTRSLLYASADARKVHEILIRLGARGAPKDAALLMLARAASQMLSAMATPSTMQAAEAIPPRREDGALFYYSGHAKDGRASPGRDARADRGAQGPDRGPPRSTSAFAILDACRSGAVTWTEGRAQARPRSRSKADSARDAKGLVILTSSTARRGLAGVGLDRRQLLLAPPGQRPARRRRQIGRWPVSLFEAYAYAYDRTVADTADSAAGAQHPTFSYDLAGNGDPVLTDVASARGRLLATRGPSGVYFLVDGRVRVPPRLRRPTASIAASRCARPLPRQAPAARWAARRRD